MVSYTAKTYVAPAVRVLHVMAAVEPTEFGQLLRRWREQRNLSQERLASMAGLSNGYVSLIETGQRQRPSRDNVIRLAQVLGAPLPEMLRAAGRLRPGDEMSTVARMSFADFVATDPALTTDQKETLVRVYRSLVGRSGT
jgi:transcriptional regulator with XRE-family HTH domain